MYARINYVDIKPEAFEQVDEFWREVVNDYEGLVKGYFLRDADTPHTLSVVVFETEKQMLENTERQLVGVVKQAADYRMNEPQLHHTQVAAHVPGHEGEVGFARVVDVTLKLDRMSEVIADWPKEVGAYAAQTGFREAYMCTDRKTGKTRSVSLWGTRADVTENETSGAFERAVEPARAMYAVEPVRSYWSVRVAVGG